MLGKTLLLFWRSRVLCSSVQLRWCVNVCLKDLSVLGTSLTAQLLASNVEQSPRPMSFALSND